MKGLIKSVGLVAWGYVFLYLDFTLSINAFTLSLLPDWACYALMLAAIPGLADYERSTLLLRPLAWLLLAWEGVLWLLKLFGISEPSGSWWYLPVLLAAVLNLYFHFQLLTNLADIASAFGCARARSIRQLRNFIALVSIVSELLEPLMGRVSPGTLEDMAAPLALAALAVALVIVVWVFSAMFGLRRELRGLDSEAGPEDEAPREG